MADGRDVPSGRLRRLSRMAQVGVRSGLSLLGDGDGSAAAQHAAALLGDLRGIAAKVGQMASYVDGMIPPAQSEAYGRWLATLQASAVSSPFAEVRAVLEAELGGPLERHFARLDPEPLASASIGQVHRARLHDGREVAVKVQHPGIADAIEADLASGGVVAQLVGTLESASAPSSAPTRARCSRTCGAVCDRSRAARTASSAATWRRSCAVSRASSATC